MLLHSMHASEDCQALCLCTHARMLTLVAHCRSTTHKSVSSTHLESLYSATAPQQPRPQPHVLLYRRAHQELVQTTLTTTRACCKASSGRCGRALRGQQLLRGRRWPACYRTRQPRLLRRRSARSMGDHEARLSSRPSCGGKSDAYDSCKTAQCSRIGMEQAPRAKCAPPSFLPTFHMSGLLFITASRRVGQGPATLPAGCQTTGDPDGPAGQTCQPVITTEVNPPAGGSPVANQMQTIKKCPNQRICSSRLSFQLAPPCPACCALGQN